MEWYHGRLPTVMFTRTIAADLIVLLGPNLALVVGIDVRSCLQG